VDPQGRGVVAGFTLSPNFPVTSGSLQPTYGGDTDAFIAVVDGTASSGPASVPYSTFFGGTQGDVAYAVATDAKGTVYVTGYTLSPNLPAPGNALQPAYDQSLDAFVLKLNPNKAGASGLDYFSYFGSAGIQIGYGIAVDAKGTVYVAGGTSGPLLGGFGGVGKATAAGNMDGYLAAFSPCSIVITPSSFQFPHAGSSIPVEVTAGDSCPWTVSNSLSWLTASPTAGNGNGVVTLTAAPNTTGGSLQGTLTIGGATFTAGQDQ
jgi:hypothetical protein